ncbi:MAG: gliding motility-associated ABC transporter substrate-binding protein GldG [Saprospiraceae bacterium]|nr:gliding motility-associated ABC transporter substrate-binding protein GldG [Saprospiraceae bacterium]
MIKKLLSLETPVRILLIIGIAILLNIVFSYLNFAIDLSEDKKFTLTQATLNTVRNVPDVIYVRVLLDGEFPSGFKRLQQSTRDLLDQFKSYNGYIEYSFENPSDGTIEEINSRRESLSKDGLVPVNLKVRSGAENNEQLIYPYAIFNYGERKIAVNLLENLPDLDQEENLNNSISQLEYKFSNALDKLQSSEKKSILITSSNGELSIEQTKAIEVLLRPFYNVSRIKIDSVYQIKSEVSVVIIPKPLKPFSERSKFILDQYIMNGGKILWFVDALQISLDSLMNRNEIIPEPLDLNLSDLFFKYGVRIQANMVLDMECSRIPQVVGKIGDKPQIELFPWYYYPIPASKSNHPVVNNIDRILLDFPASIDTLKTKQTVSKIPIIVSSSYSRFQLAPAKVGFEILRYKPDPTKFNKPNLIMGILLEGNFNSCFENRVDEGMHETLKSIKMEFKESSPFTKMIVVADGDMIKNYFDENTQKFSALGYSKFEKTTYNGNKEFFLNAIEYLTNKENILEARSKQYKIRLLDQVKIEKEKTFWQILNVGLPLISLLIFGIGNAFWRKKRYTKN